MENVIAPCNEGKWHYTEGGSQFHDSEFTSKLGRCGDGPEINTVLKGYFEFPPSTSDATRDFINACKLSADIKNVEELLDAPTLYKIAKKALMKRRESTCING